MEKIKTHISYSIAFFFQNRTVYEIMSKNVVETEGPQTARCAFLKIEEVGVYFSPFFIRLHLTSHIRYSVDLLNPWLAGCVLLGTQYYVTR
jgi:hypothetical protein